MTFKQLSNELMEQGWRCYKLKGKFKDSALQSLAIRNLLEVQVYEGKSLVFVKTIHIKPEPKKPNYGV